MRYLTIYFNMLDICIDTTQDIQKNSIYKYREKTNAGKQSVSFMAIDIWKDLPPSLKTSVFAFPKEIKRYSLSEKELN